MAALSKANQLRLAAKVEGVSLSHWGLYRQSKGVVSITSKIYIQIIDFVKDNNLLVKPTFPSLSPYSFGLLSSYFFLSFGGPLSEISPDREKKYTTCVSIVRPKKRPQWILRKFRVTYPYRSVCSEQLIVAEGGAIIVDWLDRYTCLINHRVHRPSQVARMRDI